MSLPRLTEIGDRAVLTVATAIPAEVDGLAKIAFTFRESPGEVLLWPRGGVDGFCLRVERFVLPADAAGADPIINYADMADERLLFQRTKPVRGTAPAYRLDLPPKAAVAAPSVPPAPASPAPQATPRTAKAIAPASVAPDVSAIEKRAAIHDAFERELNYVLGKPLAAVKKKKAEKNFDINAAVSFLLIEMGKRGCQ